MAKKKTQKTDSKFSKRLGSGLAHVQSFFDDVADFGFRQLKRFGSHELEEEDTSTVKGKMKTGIKKTAKFLGETGENYYDEYEKIKSDKRDQSGKTKNPS